MSLRPFHLELIPLFYILKRTLIYRLWNKAANSSSCAHNGKGRLTCMHAKPPLPTFRRTGRRHARAAPCTWAGVSARVRCQMGGPGGSAHARHWKCMLPQLPLQVRVERSRVLAHGRGADSEHAAETPSTGEQLAWLHVRVHSHPVIKVGRLRCRQRAATSAVSARRAIPAALAAALR